MGWLAGWKLGDACVVQTLGGTLTSEGDPGLQRVEDRGLLHPIERYRPVLAKCHDGKLLLAHVRALDVNGIVDLVNPRKQADGLPLLDFLVAIRIACALECRERRVEVSPIIAVRTIG